MSIFWRRKQKIANEHQADLATQVEVTKIKQQMHRAADKADAEIKKLNKQMKTSDITLNISRAIGGHHGR